MGSVLVGRDETLVLGDAVLAEACAGRGRVLLVAGEAGIGKTTLAHELFRRAEAAGTAARWGACFEGDDVAAARAADLARQAICDYDELGLTAMAEELRRLAATDQRAAEHGATHVVAPGTPGHAAATRVAVPDASAEAALVREGDTWAFTFDGTTVRARHAKGVADLAVLLSQRGQPVHVRTREGVEWVATTSDQPVLDDRAVAQYRDRLRDLEEELDEAERHADTGRATRLDAERDAVVDELTRAFGLAGRPRSVGSDPDERLRKAVSARVKASIGRIEALHPALGRHLRNSVRTGYWCSYEPERPIDWKVVTRGQP